MAAHHNTLKNAKHFCLMLLKHFQEWKRLEKGNFTFQQAEVRLFFAQVPGKSHLLS